MDLKSLTCNLLNVHRGQKWTDERNHEWHSSAEERESEGERDRDGEKERED